MNIFSRILIKTLYPFFEILQKKYLANLNKIKIQEFYKNAIINKSSTITNKAEIYNKQNDKNKIQIGEDCIISCQLMTYEHGGEIVIGSECFIGDGTKIWASKSIKIGDRVLISHNVNIHDNISHSLESELRNKEFLIVKNNGNLLENKISEKEIIIENDVWIGFNSTILKGVTIGNGAIIGANTVITKDVPPFAVCVGNPMKIIKYTK